MSRSIYKNKVVLTIIPLRQKAILIILGLVLFFILLEIGLRLGGFIISFLQEYKNIISFQKKNEYRIMCLGESTTAGGEYSYPAQLGKILNEHNIGIKFSVINKGVAGTNTSIILFQLENNLNRYSPDMVIAMMGINDSGIHIPYEDAAHSKAIFFLRSLRTYKLARLLWLHILAKAEELGFSRPKADYEIDKLKQISFKIDTKELEIKHNNYSQAENILKKAIELSPENEEAYCKLGWFYLKSGNYSQAENILKKAIEINPTKNDNAYCELGEFYRDGGNYVQAENILKRGIEINPENDGAYCELGSLYRDEGDYEQSKKMFKKSIEINPQNDEAYCELGEVYRNEGNYIKARGLYEKAVELNPENDEAAHELGWIYRDDGDYVRAEEMYKRCIKVDPGDGRRYWALGALYQEMGKYDLSRGCFRKVNELRTNYYNVMTQTNYRRLVDILNKRKIKLVCIQYPMRSIESLKEMIPIRKGIIFIDNEKIFKDAIKRDYKEYFVDRFAGDFGHCTPKGNRLLAQNIATTILKEYFNAN